MTRKSAEISAACDRIVLATSVSTVTIESTSTFTPWRARWCAMSAPGISSLFAGSLATVTTSVALARTSNGRHRIGHGTGGTPAAIPAHHDAFERQTASLNIRNDEHGPTGVE